MNGLRYIRTRCNLSISELAEQLGVTRQAICSWETGKKVVPEKRKAQLAFFFGLDEDFFDEVDEKKKDELVIKAMFAHLHGNKEMYLYRPKENPIDYKETITYYLEDREKSLDEEYILAKKRKQETLTEIKKNMECKSESDCLMSKISHLNRGCDIYGITSKLLQKMREQKAFLKIPFLFELMNVWKAMLLAYGVMDEKPLIVQNSMKHHGEDNVFLLHRADEIRTHWEEEKSWQEEYHKQVKETIHHNQGNKKTEEQIVAYY